MTSEPMDGDAFAGFTMVDHGALAAELRAKGLGKPGRRCVVVTDSQVHRLHRGVFPEGIPVIEMGRGEASKSLGTVESLLSGFMELGLGRDDLVLAIGGGVVCDTAAFAASLWMRGVPVGLVPTTLLSQADAGLGGKCGVNFRGVKNLVGAIRPAEFCLVSPDFLTTLEARDLSSGLAEVAKMAFLYDEDLLRFMESSADDLVCANADALAYAVRRSLELKAAVVARDPMEKGLRRQLNLGHTFGHAVEACSPLRHGEAVAVGMRLSARWSLERGMLAREEVERMDALLDRLRLPGVDILGKLSADDVLPAIGQDKKRQGKDVQFVFLGGLGQGMDRIPVQSVPMEEAKGWMARRLAAGNG